MFFLLETIYLMAHLLNAELYMSWAYNYHPPLWAHQVHLTFFLNTWKWDTDTSFVNRVLFFYCQFYQWSSHISMTGSIIAGDSCLVSADCASWDSVSSTQMCVTWYPILSFLPLWLSFSGVFCTTCVTVMSMTFTNINEFLFTVRLSWA